MHPGRGAGSVPTPRDTPTLTLTLTTQKCHAVETRGLHCHPRAGGAMHHAPSSSTTMKTRRHLGNRSPSVMKTLPPTAFLRQMHACTRSPCGRKWRLARQPVSSEAGAAQLTACQALSTRTSDSQQCEGTPVLDGKSGSAPEKQNSDACSRSASDLAPAARRVHTWCSTTALQR